MGQDHPKNQPLALIRFRCAFFKTMIIAAEFNTKNMKVSSTLYDVGVFPSYTKLAALKFFTAPNGNKLETAK